MHPNQTIPFSKVRLGTLTSAEADLRLRAGAVVLMPLGSLEDQGPHAPMGDYLCAETLAERIAHGAIEAGHDALVAPVLPFGGRDVFGSRIGGIALEQGTLRLVLRDMLDGLLRHGVRRLVMLNGHGGNAQAIHDETQRVWLRDGVLIPCFGLWKVAAALLPGLIGQERASRSIGHGADPLASVAMHLFPELMRPDLVPDAPASTRIVDGFHATAFGAAPIGPTPIGPILGGPTPSGDVLVDLPIELGDSAVTGDARLCSAKSGALVSERLVAAGIALVAQRAGADRA